MNTSISRPALSSAGGPNEPSSPVQGAQSFARSIHVLQVLADAGAALSRAEVLTRCTLTRPTLYRIIASLEAEGLVEQTKGNRYRLGGRLVSLARTALAQNDVRKIAEPALEHLRDVTGETIHLAIRSQDALVYIDKIESREAVRMASTIGTRVPFHSTGVGKAFLGAMAPDDADALIETLTLTPVTQVTTTSKEVLRHTVRQARRAGYVQDDQENELGIVCFGAAICESADVPVASISISVPLYRLREPVHYTGPLLQTVARISEQLGYSRAQTPLSGRN